jgi:hypothetical protein
MEKVDEERLDVLENSLLNAKRVSYDDRLLFQKSKGCYIAWEKGEIVYVGETADLNARMKDLGSTYNHIFRIHIGRKIIGRDVDSSGKYSPDEEKKIDQYFQRNITLACIPVNLGRKELEERMVQKYCKTLYNKPKKR